MERSKRRFGTAIALAACVAMGLGSIEPPARAQRPPRVEPARPEQSDLPLTVETESRDGLIARELDDRLHRDPWTKPWRIDFFVLDGVVYAGGEVDAIGPKARVTELAEAIVGVRRVADEVSFKLAVTGYEERAIGRP